MYNVSGMEAEVAESIKALIIHHREMLDYSTEEKNTYYLTSQHISSAVNLPEEHPVRRLLAETSVEGYFTHNNFKFKPETRSLSTFAADLLREIKAAVPLSSLPRDPISGFCMY
jgi:hypothetical protein